MGASHRPDLTFDVTHMVIGEVSTDSTPKYKYVARERPDVVVLRPEWIQSVRESWMSGDDDAVDLRTLEEEYRFPVFGQLSICLTGFEDCEY